MAKQKVVREIRVVFHYPRLYVQRDEEGKPVLDAEENEIPIKFVFPVTVQRKADADLAESESKLGGKSKLSAAHKLSRLLTAAPEGFEDFEDPFPTDERPLEERALEFFSKPDMEGFAEDALMARQNVLYPSQLFRES